MYIANLRIPDGKGPFDLDRKIIGLLNEVGAIKVQYHTIRNVVDELHEVPNRGAIEYRHSSIGNDIPTTLDFLENGRVQRTAQILTAGYLLLLGFEESAEYFSGLKSKLHSTLDDYLVK